MATVPADFPLAQFSVRLRCGQGAGATASNTLPVNVPRVWWFGGNCGNTSTAGGALRVFGTGLTFPPAPAAAASPTSMAAELEAAAKAALEARDFGRLEEIAKQLAAARKRRFVGGVRVPVGPKLLLTPVAAAGEAESVEVTAEQEGLSEYHARFVLPASIDPGEYRVSVANELGLVGPVPVWEPVNFFESPARPHVQTIEVVAPAVTSGLDGTRVGSMGGGVPRSFQSDTVCARVPPSVFTVANQSRMPPVRGEPLIDSTTGLVAALAAAGKAGGGTVFFPRGQYYLRGSFEIPSNTYLKGEGQDLVALYWAEANLTDHPTFLFRGASSPQGSRGPVRWGLSDLTIYATAFYCKCEHRITPPGGITVDHLEAQGPSSTGSCVNLHQLVVGEGQPRESMVA